MPTVQRASIVQKVWDGVSAYVWPTGIAPPDNAYTNICFIDPTGTHDPATSTGGRTVVNDLWEPGAATTVCYGQLAYAEQTAYVSSIGTTLVEITGLRLTYTQPTPARRIEVGFNGFYTKDATSAAAVSVFIKEGATQLSQRSCSATGNQWGAFDVRRSLTPSVGAHTYSFWMSDSGATVQLAADPTYPAISWINDIGP